MDISKPLGSLGNLTSAFKINSPTIDSKDIDSLTKSIDNLTKILNKRTGKVKKSSESTIDKEDKQGNLFTDIKDFGKGFISPFADAKKYIFGGKNTMPPGIDLKTNEDAEKSDNKVLTLALYENENSVFKSDYVGEYYNNTTEDLTFWWEEDNKHWD